MTVTPTVTLTVTRDPLGTPSDDRYPPTPSPTGWVTVRSPATTVTRTPGNSHPTHTKTPTNQPTPTPTTRSTT
jgi:hypothetical protein